MKKEITEEIFLEGVMHEINMIKEHATDEEKANLNFQTFDSSDAENCIYGQMTGDCRTERAFDLMKKACKRTFSLQWNSLRRGDEFEDYKDLINGKFKGQGWIVGKLCRDWDYLSSLEGYIQTVSGEKNKEIISYIKGETETLEL